MAATGPKVTALGSMAPDFALTDVSTGATVARTDFDGAVLVVMFLSQHCPYVQHVEKELGRLAEDYQGRGVAFVGICANDISNYPDDAPSRLVEQKQRAGFNFPYLFDESQEVAHRYGAMCTPEFFVYDAHHRLVYRGQMDDSRPGGAPPTGADLRAAIEAAIDGNPTQLQMYPAMGCSIKWREGNEPS